MQQKILRELAGGYGIEEDDVVCVLCGGRRPKTLETALCADCREACRQKRESLVAAWMQKKGGAMA